MACRGEDYSVQSSARSAGTRPGIEGVLLPRPSYPAATITASSLVFLVEIPVIYFWLLNLHTAHGTAVVVVVGVSFQSVYLSSDL